MKDFDFARSGTMMVNTNDALMLKGVIQFALDMSGGQANVRSLRDFVTRVDEAIAGDKVK